MAAEPKHEFVELPVTFSKDEAVGLLQYAGIVGCGGAGFPTYVKYRNPQPTVLVNAAESEGGYYANKLLLRDRPDALVNLFNYLRLVFGIKNFIVGVEDVARPYCTRLEELEARTGLFRMAYFEPLYKYGQEKALAERVLGVKIGKGQIPPDLGIIVNNNETLYNMYRALFQNKPVTTKQFQIFGEVQPIGVYEAPIGSLVTDILKVHGTDPTTVANCKLYDGGPILADLVMGSVGLSEPHAVRPTTNGLLFVDPAKDRPRNRYYPNPSYEHNTADAPWAPTKIENIETQIERVRIPVKPRFCKPPHVVVKVGDAVERDQAIARPASDGFSIGVCASIPGKVTAMTDDWVQIERAA